MSVRGEHAVDPGILSCLTTPCPAIRVGQVIAIELDPVRAHALGFRSATARVNSITPALHAYMIAGPTGDVIVGGHRSRDRITVR
jgi:hypothetical protein